MGFEQYEKITREHMDNMGIGSRVQFLNDGMPSINWKITAWSNGTITMVNPKTDNIRYATEREFIYLDWYLNMEEYR